MMEFSKVQHIIGVFLAFFITSNVVAQDDIIGSVKETYLRRVVVEKGTGQWCGYCPRGIVGFEVMSLKYANSFIGISLHRASEGGSETLSKAENYSELVFQGYPNSYVNRHIKHSDPGLPTIENDFRHEVSPATMQVTLTDWTLDKSTRSLQLTATVRAGASHTNAPFRLAYVITENGPKGFQRNYYTDNARGEMGGWESKPAYVSTSYNDVARGIYPNIYGAEGSVPAVLEAQTNYTHHYTITVPSQINGMDVNIDSIRLTALLIDAVTGEIVNAHRVNPNIVAANWTDPVDAVTPVYIDDNEEPTEEPQVEHLHFVNRNGLIISNGFCVNMIHTGNDSGNTYVGDDDIKIKKTAEGNASFKVRYKVVSMPAGTQVTICMNDGCIVASSANPIGETLEGSLSYGESENISSKWGGNIQPGTSCVVDYTIIYTTNDQEVEGEHISVRYCYPEDHELLPWDEHVGEAEDKHIYNIDALRTYRLAILVSPNTYYTLAGYSGNRETEVANIRTAIQAIVNNLNLIFMRDVGVRFEWIDDESLYVRDYAEIGWTASKGSTGIHNELGPILNERIGNDAYDIGMTYSDFAEAEGMASICGAYNTAWKAHVVARYHNNDNDAKIVAHELGHMFGANHRDQRTLMSPYVNQHEVPYFSAQNIREMRRYLAKIPYFRDAERTHLIGSINDAQFNNYVVAKPISSTAPVLDKSDIRAEYIVPAGSMYQFNLKGTTTHGTSLFRAELDTIVPQDHYAWFYPKMPNTDGHFEWTDDDTAQNATAPKAGDVCKFLFTMSNPPADNNVEDLVQYDYAYTQLRFAAGQPFVVQPLTDTYWDYGYRQAITLNWTYDEQIYKGKKVRILFSSDYGRNYSVVLRDSVSIGTAGAGTCQIPLPSIETDRPDIASKRPGNIKIEIIGEPVFGLLQTNMENGGLTITKNNTRLIFSPEVAATAHISAATLQNNDGVKAYYKTTSGTEYSVTYTYEKINSNTYIRRWTAMYGTKPYVMEQIATIDGTLPDEPDPGTDITDELAEVRNAALQELASVPQTAGYPSFGERVKLIEAIRDKNATEASIADAMTAFKATDDIILPKAGHTYQYRPYYQKKELNAQNITSIGDFTLVHATPQNMIMERPGQFNEQDLLGCVMLKRSAYPSFVHWNVGTSGIHNLYQFFYSEEDAITCLWHLEDVTSEKVIQQELITNILTQGASGEAYDFNNDGIINISDVMKYLKK